MTVSQKKLRLFDLPTSPDLVNPEGGLLHSTAQGDYLFPITSFVTLGQIAVANVAALRLTEPNHANQQISLAEYNAGTGLGGGVLVHDASDTTSPDDGMYCFVTLGGKRWKRSVAHRQFDVFMAGAVGDGVTDDYYAFQRATLAVHAIGGGSIYVPVPLVEYRITFPVFLFDNTAVFGAGQMSRIVFEDPIYANKGRGGFVMGSSVECGRSKAIAAFKTGNITGANITDNSFVNPAMQAYLRDNPQFTQSENCSIHDLYLVAKYTGAILNGGYGVNMCNANDCETYRIWGEGWTEIVNMGSDTAPETPSCYRCHAHDIYCVSPNQSKTYYSIGFIANSTDCSIVRAEQWAPMTVGTQNGSGIATNACENINIDDIRITSLGLTVSSEGILLNNTVNSTINNIRIGNCKTCVATYYTLAAYIDATKWNKISNVYGSNCTQVIALRGKYCTVENYSGDNYTYDLFFGTSNASNNVVRTEPKAMGFGGTTFPAIYLSNNEVKGWVYQYIYMRPLPLLVNDKVDVNGYNSNKTIATKAGVSLKFMGDVPNSFKAISDLRCFLTLNAGSLTANTSVTMSVRRMIAYDGNINAAPLVEFTNVRVAASDALMDTTLVAQSSGTAPGYTLVGATSGGLGNALDFYIEFLNPTLNSYMKEIRMGGYK